MSGSETGRSPGTIATHREPPDEVLTEEDSDHLFGAVIARFRRHIQEPDTRHLSPIAGSEALVAPLASLCAVFERFTDRGRSALIHAQQEARVRGHDHIGTEHLLLGLMDEKEGVAARALAELGVTLERVWDEIEQTVGRTAEGSQGNASFTPRLKEVLELSLRECLQQGHNYIGTEHLLLGLVREGEGVGARVLLAVGVELPRVRQSVLQVMSGYQGKTTSEVVSQGFESSDSPRCGGCSSELELALRYRSITVPPTFPDHSSLKVQVLYCGRCGRVASIFRAETTS